MGKIITAFLLLSIMLTTATPLRSQTRPRRVLQAAGAPSRAPALTRAGEQPSVLSSRARTVHGDAARYERERRGSRWPRILLGAGIAIGIGSIGRSRSCSPSRGVIGELPRLMSRIDSPR
jgi:hypothetical protein